MHAFGAALDHVHLLVQLPADVSVAAVLSTSRGGWSPPAGGLDGLQARDAPAFMPGCPVVD